MFFDGLDLTPRKRPKLDMNSFNAYVPPPERAIDWFTYDQLIAAQGSALVHDVESYPNYWCVAFKCIVTGKVTVFERSPEADFDGKHLLWVLKSFVLVGFNSKRYDIYSLAAAIDGYSAEELHELTKDIIEFGLGHRDICEKWKLDLPEVNHIDLIEVAPLSESLKTYSGRLHCQRMQDLPFQPNTVLTKEQARVVMLYCVNDLDNTELLCKELSPQLDLRHALGQQYGVDLRSMSDAQLAEAVLISEIRKKSPKGLKKPNVDFNAPIQYKAPAWVSFKTPKLQELLAQITCAEFYLNGAGNPGMPESLKPYTAVAIGKQVYTVGIGGLHSTEKSIGYVVGNSSLIIDNDVASYYPRIIINEKLYPKHLGKVFLEVYNGIVERRLAAKNAKRMVEADSLKITINGSFGKLGSMYSMLYAPDLMLQVTITGQLGLLMQIEMLELAGIPVISANTDGVVTLCPQDRYDDLRAVITEWERITNFVTEETRYRSLWSRDVNNYVAIKLDGTPKAKGVYSEKGSALNSVLSKNPEHLICSDALKAFLGDGTPIEQTVRACQDIRRFVSVRKVQGGAVKDGAYLGKVVRWYYAEGDAGSISYARSGNKVPKTDVGKPCMDLPDTFPDDIAYEWYIDKAYEMLREVGYYNQNGSGQLF